MPPPPVTPRAGGRAWGDGPRAGSARAAVRGGLKEGGASITAVLKQGYADALIGRLRVSAVLESMPGVGKARAAKIMERLRTAKSKGYVLSVADYFASDISVGAPVMSRNGLVQGAISLSVSIDRYTAKEVEAKFAKVVSAAAKSVLI